ncbi:unnamed protein product, partial [Porites evermanni]
MTSPEEFKEKFYNNLREVLWRAPCTDKLIIAADFDARVGKEDKWPCVIGPRGVSKCNSHSELLLGLSSEHNLVITNTISKRKKHHKTTWMQPRYKHWHLLDYMTVRQQKHSKTAAKAPCKIDVMELRDKENQEKLKKEVDKALAGFQHQ